MNTCTKCDSRADAIGRSGSDAWKCSTCGWIFDETVSEMIQRNRCRGTNVCGDPCRGAPKAEQVDKKPELVDDGFIG